MFLRLPTKVRFWALRGYPGRSGAPRRPLARAFLGHVWYVFSRWLF